MFLTNQSNQDNVWITGVILLDNNISEVGNFFSLKSKNIGQTWNHFCEDNYMNWVSDQVKTFNDSDMGIWE